MQLWNELYCDSKKFYCRIEQINDFLPRVAELKGALLYEQGSDRNELYHK